MSSKNISLFFARAESDPDLSAQMKSLQDESVEAFVARLVGLSQKAGLPFTEDELTEAAQAAASEDLSDALHSGPGSTSFSDASRRRFRKSRALLQG